MQTGDLVRVEGRYDEAEPLYLESLEGQTRVLGEEDNRTLWTMNNLAVTYSRQGRYDEAEPLSLEVVETRRRVLGEEHRDTLAARNNLGGLYTIQGKYEQAAALLEAVEANARERGAVLSVVICPHLAAEKRSFLAERGFEVTSEWHVRNL